MSIPQSPRPVARLVQSQRVQVAPGFFVRRALPAAGLDMIDPWLMLDHFGPVDIAPGEASGVPAHPHRGFEPTTYLIDGMVEHRDSAGNHVVVRGGDINWMTAGSGIVHSEMPPEEFKKSGGRSHGFQIWVNLPRGEQLSTPGIQYVPAADVPVVMFGEARAKIIAGELNGVHGKVRTHSPVMHMHLTIPPGSDIVLPVPSSFNVFAYVAEGTALAGQDRIAAHAGTLVMFGAQGDSVVLGADGGTPCEVLVLGGEPLNQPVCSYGPFVMSTREEIQQAMDDYHDGKFGVIAQ